MTATAAATGNWNSLVMAKFEARTDQERLAQPRTAAARLLARIALPIIIVPDSPRQSSQL